MKLWAFAALFTLIAAAALRGDEPKRDLYGDPLPDGAIARLGTVQRRLSPQQLAQTADGKSLVGVILGRFVTIWDAQTFQVKERFELNRPEGDAKVISSLLAPDARTGAVFTPRGVEFWDLSSRKLRSRDRVPDSRAV